MKKPSLLITRPLPDRVLRAAREICDVTASPDNTGLAADEAGRCLIRHDAILTTLGDVFSREAFCAAHDCRCRLLANFGVGYNHIDVGAAREKGITVTNTPGAVTDATADIAITLMLMAARRAGEGERMVRAGRWPGWNPTQMLGTHIGGKTLGIIGMGRIGRAIAHRAHFGFGMRIIFFNRSPVTDCGIPGARQIAGLRDLMAASDVVSLSVPGGSANRHLVSAEVLAAARPETILVNTARGDVIDQSALVAALQNGRLRAAGLDVYEDEPYVPDDLIALENVVLLPHMGTNALEVRTQMGLMAIDNIRAFFRGETPANVVEP